MKLLHVRAVVALFLLTALAGAAPALGQTPLTLADALRLAADHSEALEVARAGESRADAGAQRAASEMFPQLSFSGGYTRTLASEFSGAFGSSGPVCPPLTVDPNAPLGDRIAEIERAAGCGALGGLGFNFENLPFGQRNIYQLGLTFSQTLYAGGRIGAQREQARLGRELAAMTTTATGAQLAFDVTQAYFNAALADRLLDIAQYTYDQAAATYEQVRLAFSAGSQPEFELLRAQVARDNHRPTVIRRRADRDVAYLRLRQLLELAPDAPLQLDVDLENPELPPPAPFAEALEAAAELPVDGRIAVRQSAAVVASREAAVTAARSARLPSVSVNSFYNRVGYPSEGAFPDGGDFRTNWSLGATVQVPIFTGFRLKAEELSARADLAQAQAELQQMRELAVLDASTVRQDLQAAQAVWEASAGTIQQADRAYQIAELRNREGLSTQLEINDARLSLEIARANRALAARDLQVARARLALLPNLPAAAR
jgi:outer membrane protein TolC